MSVRGGNLATGGPEFPGVGPGKWLHNGQSTGNQSFGPGGAFGSVVYTGKARTLDRYAFRVGVAAVGASVVRGAIYSVDSTSGDCTLILDVGSVDATTAADKIITISQAVPAGHLFLPLAVQGAPTTNPVLTIFSTGTPLAQNSFQSSDNSLAWQFTIANGSPFPATIPAANLNNAGVAPRVGLRVA